MQPQQVVHHHHHHSPPKSAGVAIALELGGGWFFQTFGIGHLYAGNIGLGLAFMFGYWFVTFINILLCFILIGAITWPLCWIAMMILSPILVSNKVKEINVQALR